jgi:hypothetical protein
MAAAWQRFFGAQNKNHLDPLNLSQRFSTFENKGSHHPALYDMICFLAEWLCLDFFSVELCLRNL